MVVAALLFLAFAYFAVGQAVVNRGDAQGAADAAALAAANEAREQIADDLIDDIEDLEEWEELLQGLLFPNGPSCAKAESFASKNNAQSESCARTGLPRKGFSVTVRTTGSVGSSVIPGTDSVRSTAKATAVLEPRCELAVEPDGDGDLIELDCDGDVIEIDPEDPDPIPDPGLIFDVRLVD
ncbi:pilus assembly protein TadG-related protein [Streptomyces sp. XM4193]|nr:pilus assembly protein TadG-related protein [Streptomyces sp. XM4193]